MKRAAVPTSLLLALAACVACAAGADSPASYYPLDPGRSWHYRFAGSNGITGTAVVTNQPPRELGAAKVVPQKIEMWKQEGYELIGEDAGGLFLAGEQIPATAAIRPKQPPSYVLKPPFQTGATWQGTSKTHMWAPDTALATTLTIQATAETVTVPAGTFSGCLLIEEKGVAKPGGSLTQGIAVANRSWFAPGVGIVKETLHESVGATPEQNGTLTFQLESYTK
jgi:hypothetical protein